MAITMDKSHKKCGTCIYWGGRKSISYGKATFDISECGKCSMGVFSSNPKGHNCGEPGCNKYSLDPSIR